MYACRVARIDFCYGTFESWQENSMQLRAASVPISKSLPGKPYEKSWVAHVISRQHSDFQMERHRWTAMRSQYKPDWAHYRIGHQQLQVGQMHMSLLCTYNILCTDTSIQGRSDTVLKAIDCSGALIPKGRRCDHWLAEWDVSSDRQLSQGAMHAGRAGSCCAVWHQGKFLEDVHVKAMPPMRKCKISQSYWVWIASNTTWKPKRR